MEDPTKPRDHDNHELLATDQKPMSQPRIRRFALIYIIIGLLGLLAVAALAFALSRPASNQATINPTTNHTADAVAPK
jgi:multisubunit Na+/H+ antiporter MnhB subunit